VIKFDCVGLRYREKQIFDCLSFEVARGDKVVILGPSGLGKSSLFSLVLGFVRPSCGSVYFEGDRVDERTVWRVRRKVSFVDQDVSIGPGKVSEWIAFVSGLRANASVNLGGHKFDEMMAFLGLGSDLLDQDISGLSGGERQRLAIVLSVLLGREVFLLDEVTSSLDASLKRKVADFFLGEESRTVVVISHENVWLNHPASMVFNLEDGKWIR